MSWRKTHAFGAATQRGDWPWQEDGFFLEPVSGVYAIADGLGGEAGASACREALLGIKNYYLSQKSRDGLPELLRGLHKKQRENNKAASAPDRRGAVSLLLAEACPGGVYRLTGAGACSALLLRNGRLHPLWIPQSPSLAGDWVPALPERAIGLGDSDELPLSTRYVRLLGGDFLLLASSGLEFTQEEFLGRFLSALSERVPGGSLQELCSALVESFPFSHGKSRNRSLIVVETPVE